MRIAMIGTRGVPARYGGFETAVEEIGARLAEAGDEVIVYSRNRANGQQKDQQRNTWRGMRIVDLPALRTRTTETLSHAMASTAHAIITDRPDVAFVFNAANAPVIPVLKAAGIPVAVNIDGLEAKRAKWRGLGAHYFRWAEGAAVRWADATIADSRVIADHLRQRHGIEATYIPYGATAGPTDPSILAELGLAAEGYLLVVARLEPENKVDVIVRAYADVPGEMPLVIVGTSPYSRDHVEQIRGLAAKDQRVRMLGGVYDRPTLDTLLAHSRLYLHGHSVGGTNPILLRAGLVAPVLPFDSPFNREVLGYAAQGYWRDAQSLQSRIRCALNHPRIEPLGALLSRRFDWDLVAQDYLRLARRMVGLEPGYSHAVSVKQQTIVDSQRYGHPHQLAENRGIS